MKRTNLLNKRGVAMTEYAVLLAFVAAVAVAFTSDSGLAASIKGAITKADNAIAMIAGEKNSISTKIKGFCSHVKEKQGLPEAVSKVIDGVYDTFAQDNIKLASVALNGDGKIKELYYYKDDGTIQKVPNLNTGNFLKYKNTNFNELLANSGYKLVSGYNIAINNQKNSWLSYDRDGNIQACYDNQDGSKWSKLFLQKGDEKGIEVGAQEKNNTEFRLQGERNAH